MLDFFARTISTTVNVLLPILFIGAIALLGLSFVAVVAPSLSNDLTALGYFPGDAIFAHVAPLHALFGSFFAIIVLWTIGD